MKLKNVRFHLRHTGSQKFRKPHLTTSSGRYSWGWNLTIGRWVLVARRPSPHAKGFFDLEFGRSMLKERKRWMPRRVRLFAYLMMLETICIIRGGHDYGTHFEDLFDNVTPGELSETPWCGRCGKDQPAPRRVILIHRLRPKNLTNEDKEHNGWQ